MKERGREHQGTAERDLSNHVEMLHLHSKESKLFMAAAQSIRSLHLNSQATSGSNKAAYSKFPCAYNVIYTIFFPVANNEGEGGGKAN